MSDPIASRKLWLIDKANRIDITIEIGRPRWIEPEARAACLVYVRGIMRKPLDIYGADLLSALQCSLEFVEAELRNLPPHKVVQWPGGEAYFE
jgi:hypothetical protein